MVANILSRWIGPAARRALLSILALLLTLSTTGCGDPNKAINVGTALQRAAKTNQIVLVEFWAFNDACRQMDAKVYDDPLLQNELKDFIRVRMNHSLSRDTAANLGVTAAPGFASLRSDGSLIAARTGYMDTDTYRQFLVRSRIFYRQ